LTVEESNATWAANTIAVRRNTRAPVVYVLYTILTPSGNIQH
jgi:hypothetical protein